MHKRVYRTGQTRPVVVKTLAIRDTVEQEMLERRAGIVARTAKMPALTEEASMRSYIEVSIAAMLGCDRDVTRDLAASKLFNRDRQ